MDLSSIVLLDFVACALTLFVAGFFAVTWRRLGNSLHLLFAVGFGLVALGYTGVFTSEFELTRKGELWDAVRFAGHTGGALVIAFAYMSARQHGTARPWRVLGWSIAALGILMVLLYLAVPPFMDLSLIHI